MFASRLNIGRFLHTTTSLTAGHSKWANIKHIKALKDGQKSLLFTKLGRQIRLAMQEGNSPNPDLNPVLRSAIDEALKKSMPQASIQNILKKSASAGELRKHLLEIKALNKIFIVALVYTENITGVKMNVSTILRKNAAIWSETRHLFVDKGLVQANASARHTNGQASLEEVCTDDAIDCGAEDVEVADEPTKIVNFFCDPAHLERVKKELMAKNYEIENTEHIFIPNAEIELTEMEREIYEKLKTKLKNERIDEVYDNVKELMTSEAVEAERKTRKI